ncbi:hypothetical protein WJX74_006380 [Apatococcus lobatus]|uniref:Cyanate lyase C-terminal domain-containing protein n=1 Tax=Apatococcus lobatus TaxID=904363 RepID=A0AAW1RFK3_9CHLO
MLKAAASLGLRHARTGFPSASTLQARVLPFQVACSRPVKATAVQISAMSTQPSSPAPTEAGGKLILVNSLLAAKEASGKTFTQISKEIGLTNAFTAQLFYNQAQLKKGTVDKLRKAVPDLNDAQIEVMQRCPMRGYDPAIAREPHIYRTTEAVLHYAEAIKAIMNEELGDGIMSAIDMFATVDKIKGKTGEDRLVITLNGKFLPHIEQVADNNTATPQTH